MPNYDRYRGMTAARYERWALTSWLCRIPSEPKLLAVLAGLRGLRVLDVGLGSGRYTRLLVEANEVVGVDRNPHLCELPITVHAGDATELSRHVAAASFDAVVSTWMSEYLAPGQLRAFFVEAGKVLRPGGRLVATVVSRCGLGWAYVRMARLRGVAKYGHGRGEVLDGLAAGGFVERELVDLRGRMGLPWAYLVDARTPGAA